MSAAVAWALTGPRDPAEQPRQGSYVPTSSFDVLFVPVLSRIAAPVAHAAASNPVEHRTMAEQGGGD